MRRGVLVSILGAYLLMPASVDAQGKKRKLSVTVIDVAGGQVYVEPGADKGVRLGQTVRVGKRNYTVSSVNASSAALTLVGAAPRVGAKGSARVSTTASEVREIATPTSLDSFRNQWKPAVRPAQLQTPEKIVIAMTRKRSPTEITVIARGSATHVLSSDEDTIGHLSARTIVNSQPFGGVPLGIDADLEFGQWFGRKGDQGSLSRPLVQLQELRLRYGDIDASNLSLGRLRDASRQVGLIDGVRVYGEVAGGLSVFAFGGLVPSYLDGKPSNDLARFGAGVRYIDDENSMRPNAEMTFYASNFDGSLDEKRASLDMHIHPGPLSVALTSELSLFPSDNPWGASAIELTLASLDTRYRKGRFSTGISLSAQQPERSRWLASLLPMSWLCTTTPVAGMSEESCNGDRNYRYFALYNASYLGKGFQLQSGATTIVGDQLQQLALFGDLRVPVKRSTLGVSLLVSDSEFLRSWAARMEVARPLWESADVVVFYRPEVHAYLASLSSVLEHRIGAEASMPVGQDLFVRLSGETVQSSEIRYISSFLTLVWRTGM